MIIRKTALAAAIVAAGIATPAVAVPTPVSLELALLVDVSGSISTSEYNLQKQGYVDAFMTLFSNPGVAGYIHNNGPIAVTYVEWSGASQQSQLVDWTLIGNAADAQAFANMLNGTSRAFNLGSTAPGSAIEYIVPQFSTNNFEADRWIIDVSGDGIQTANATGGVNTAAARDAALLAGVSAINGLPILGETGLEQWYIDNIQGGAGSFVLAAENFDKFGEAIADKIGREVAMPEPGSLALLGLGLTGLGLLRRRRA